MIKLMFTGKDFADLNGQILAYAKGLESVACTLGPAGTPQWRVVGLSLPVGDSPSGHVPGMIPAIKALREVTCMGLAEALAAVREMLAGTDKRLSLTARQAEILTGVGYTVLHEAR